MDNVYTRADEKAQKFMTENLKRLNNEYDNSKMIKQDVIDNEKDDNKREDLKSEKLLRENMKDYIPKLEAEWKKVKDWDKPN
jgi:hypothetical protein